MRVYGLDLYSAIALLIAADFVRQAWVDLVLGEFINERLVRHPILRSLT